MHDLLVNIDRIHTTKLGGERIRKNLGLADIDAVAWCKRKVQSAGRIVKQGKNWYVHAGDCVITVNAHSFTIITAHVEK